MPIKEDLPAPIKKQLKNSGGDIDDITSTPYTQLSPGIKEKLKNVKANVTNSEEIKVKYETLLVSGHSKLVNKLYKQKNNLSFSPTRTHKTYHYRAPLPSKVDPVGFLEHYDDLLEGVRALRNYYGDKVAGTILEQARPNSLSNTDIDTLLERVEKDDDDNQAKLPVKDGGYPFFTIRFASYKAGVAILPIEFNSNRFAFHYVHKDLVLNILDQSNTIHQFTIIMAEPVDAIITEHSGLFVIPLGQLI